MNSGLLFLVGYCSVSLLCTLLILGACIISHKATRAREREREFSAYNRVDENLLSGFERVRALWRRV